MGGIPDCVYKTGNSQLNVGYHLSSPRSFKYLSLNFSLSDVMRLASAYVNQLLTQFGRYDEERHTLRDDVVDIRNRFDVSRSARSLTSTIRDFIQYLSIVEDILPCGKQASQSLWTSVGSQQSRLVHAARSREAQLESRRHVLC